MSCNPYFSLNLTSAEMEENLLSMGSLFARENDSALLYDQQFLNNSIIALNNLVYTAKNSGYDYPMLYDRIEVGPISPTEYADFLIATGTDQATVESINSSTDNLTVTSIQYLENVNTYYTDNFSSSITGGFCAMYSQFSSFLSQALSFISAAQNILSQLGNIQQLINQLIDTIVDKVMSIINQLIGQINKCLGSVQNVANKIQNITSFFSPAGIQSIKDNVATVIADIGSKFEIPQTQTDPLAIVAQELEAVNYLLYRLCQFTTAIEDFMMAPVKALQDAIANCSQVGSVLTNVSNQFTLNSVLAGAFRMSDSQVDAIKAQLASDLNGTSSGSGLDADGAATPSHYWTQEFNEDENRMFTELISAGANGISGTTVSKYLDFDTNGIATNPGNQDIIPGQGVLKLQASIVIIAVRIAKRLGTKLIVNSGYRSASYNASVGGATNSCHMSGLALDIRRSSFGNDFASGEKFIKIASQEGIGGIGTYSSFIHIDTGQRRTWTGAGGSYAPIPPMDHLTTLSTHEADGFRMNKTGVRSSAF